MKKTLLIALLMIAGAAQAGDLTFASKEDMMINSKLADVVNPVWIPVKPTKTVEFPMGKEGSLARYQALEGEIKATCKFIGEAYIYGAPEKYSKGFTYECPNTYVRSYQNIQGGSKWVIDTTPIEEYKAARDIEWAKYNNGRSQVATQAKDTAKQLGL